MPLCPELSQGLRAVCISPVTLKEAVRLNLPYWLCRLCGLCEAVCRSTGIPPTFYLVVHKDAHVVSSGYASKQRMWAVADPGTGKGHAADPHVDIPTEVCAELPELCIGTPPHFHMVRTRTNAAFENTMGSTRRYGACLTGDGKPLCCPSWPVRGVWEQNTGIPMNLLMDAAYGRTFGAETKDDQEKRRKGRAANEKEQFHAFHADTDINIGLLVQDSAQMDWHVMGESIQKRRPGFSLLDRGRTMGPLKIQDVIDKVYDPLVQDLFRVVLHRFRPRFFDPRDRVGPHHAVFEMRSAQERLVKNSRVKCEYGEDHIAVPAIHKKFLNALNKSGYWVPLLSWENTVFGGCVFFFAGQRDRRLHSRSSPTNQHTGDAYLSVHGYVIQVAPPCIWKSTP